MRLTVQEFGHSQPPIPIHINNSMGIGIINNTKNMHSTKERIQKFVNSPQSVERFMKVFDYKDSKFKTMTHSDMWTSQIMFSLNKDG